MKPNILLVTIDQLRPFEIGCYGNRIVRTPHIDQLAEDSVRFEFACTNNPVCTPARSCLLSGQYSRSCTGMLGCVGNPGEVRNHFPNPTLPELLKNAGYDTALFGKWHVGPNPHLVGFDDAVYPKVSHLNVNQMYFRDGQSFVVEGYAPDYEYRQWIEWLGRRSGERPWFAYYNISLPHMPLFDIPENYKSSYHREEVPIRYNATRDGRLAYDEHWFKIYGYDYLYYKENRPHCDLPQGFDLRDLTALYYGAVAAADDQVGRLLDSLQEFNLKKDTLIVLVSDHGDHLGSHGRFNKLSVYEEAIRIPYLIAWPGQLEPSVNEDQVASLVDIAPTVLSLIDVEGSQEMQGIDLSPVLRNERKALERQGAFIENLYGEIALRTPSHLYSVNTSIVQHGPERTILEQGDLLFDTIADPWELTNLAASRTHQSVRGAMWDRIRQFNENIPWMRGSRGGSRGDGSSPTFNDTIGQGFR